MSRTIYKNQSPRTISELLAYELFMNYCRKSGVITASSDADLNLVIGTPLASVNDIPVLFNPEGSDGSEVITGLSLTSVDVPRGASEDISVLKNGPAIVVENRIVWPDGMTPAQISAAKSALENKGIQFITGQGTTN